MALQGVLGFGRGLAAHDAFNAAASIAFRLFLSLVPLLVLVGYVVGQFARARGVDQVVGPLLGVVPGDAEELIRKELERLAGASTLSMAPLGVAGFLWTASSGLHNLMTVLEAAARSKRRPWWKIRTIAIGWVLLGLLVTCAFAWFLVHADAARTAHGAIHAAARIRASEGAGAARAAGPRVRKMRLSPEERTADALFALALGTTLLAGFYRYAVEHAPGVRRRVWPGALAAVLFWLVVSWAFGAYAVSIGDYTIYYGGLAAVAVLLLWLYLTSLALLVGAEVNAQLEGIRDYPGQDAL
jgi:membrane protein